MPTANANDVISGRDPGDESNVTEVTAAKTTTAKEIVQEEPTPTNTICYPYPPEHDDLGRNGGYSTTTYYPSDYSFQPAGYFFRPHRPNKNKEEEKENRRPPQSKL